MRAYPESKHGSARLEFAVGMRLFELEIQTVVSSFHTLSRPCGDEETAYISRSSDYHLRLGEKRIRRIELTAELMKKRRQINQVAHFPVPVPIVSDTSIFSEKSLLNSRCTDRGIHSCRLLNPHLWITDLTKNKDDVAKDAGKHQPATRKNSRMINFKNCSLLTLTVSPHSTAHPTFLALRWPPCLEQWVQSSIENSKAI